MTASGVASGQVRSEDDVRALTEDYFDAARRDWRVRPGQHLDVAIYAHGGLVSERDAAAAFAHVVPDARAQTLAAALWPGPLCPRASNPSGR